MLAQLIDVMITEVTEKLKRTLHVSSSTERKKTETLRNISCIPDGILASDAVYPP